jgi:starch synthase
MPAHPMDPLKICLVASEVSPFAKTGGLADVVAALARFLHRVGHDARVVMPLHRVLRHKGHELELVPELRDIAVKFGRREVRFSVERCKLPSSKASVYCLDCPELYDRDGIYRNDGDEQIRFALLSRATLVLSQWLRWAPDVFHCNDWHTGLLPFYLKTVYAWDKLFESSCTVLTLHNVGYQGWFGGEVIDELGLGEVRQYFHQRDLQRNAVSYLKTGLLYADALTTVSETYAAEILDGEQGMGLEETLRGRASSLVGIVNGVDYGEWNPATDKRIEHRYSERNLGGKLKNKEALLDRFEMSHDPQTLVLGIVSRLTAQKGFELLPEILPVLLHRDPVRLVILGSGEEKYEKYFHWLRGAFPSKVGFHCGYDEGLAHLVEAGADAFVMPSRYEPCGLNQLYSLKYGTPPIVRRTGGLADTVQQWDPRERTGTGFLFDEFKPVALLAAIEQALATWRDQDAWRALMKNGMAEDWSWDKQGQHYVALYDRLRRGS